jgi:AmiR/NasT family two-component response regulator
MASMPVIEQAKGVLMAQSGCDADEAFDTLRRASQRSHIPVRDLAGQIVARTARSAQAPPFRRIPDRP